MAKITPDLNQAVPRKQAVNETGKRPVVSTENFSIYYGSDAAIDNITIDVPAQAVTAIIGPSGCGKSTLLRAVNRMNDLIPHCSCAGRMLVEGKDIYNSDIDVVNLRKRVGMVFQKPNPFPKSIFDNIAYGPRLHGIRKKNQLMEIVESSLERAGLFKEVSDRLHKNALALSGGQQQRLCIARSLAINPHILLMDEPCSALDPQATARIEDLIEELGREYTIFIVTHNMQQAARVSDVTAFLYEGKLIEFGETNSLFTNPKNKQTEDYITGRFG